MRNTIGAIWALARRDLVLTLRQRRIGVVLCITLLSFGMYTLMNVPPRDSSPLEIADYVDTSIAVTGSILLLCIAIVVPAYGATSFTAEREEQTYDLLRLALIPPWGVVLGKMITVSALCIIMIATAAPFVASNLLFSRTVPISGVTLGFTVAVLVVVSWSVTCVSVCCSVMAHGSGTALLGAYLCTFTLMGGSFGFLTGIPFLFQIDRVLYHTLVKVIFPHYLVLEASEGNASLAELFLVAGWHVLIGGAAFLTAVRSASHARERQAVGKPVSRRRWRTALMHLCARPREEMAPKAPMGDLLNPIFLRELRYNPASRSAFRWGTLAGGLLIGMGSVILAAADPIDYQYEMAGFFPQIAAGLGGIVLSAGMLTSESERGNLEPLIATRLTPPSILLGKVLAALIVLAPLLAGLSLGLATGLALGCCPESGFGLWMSLTISAFVKSWTAMSLGFVASALVRRTRNAVLLGCGLAALVFWGPIISLEFVTEFRQEFLVDLYRVSAWFSPWVQGSGNEPWLAPFDFFFLSHEGFNVMLGLCAFFVAMLVFRRNCLRGSAGTR